MRNRVHAYALIASLSLTTPCLAQSANAPSPAPSTAAPAQPAAKAPEAPLAAPVVDATQILVLPFAEVSDGGKRDWIGRAMHQSMLAELARLRFVEPLSPNGAAATDLPTEPEAAARAGKDAGAAYVVFGSYQIIEDDLRVTGQIIDVATGKVAGGIKATGNVRDLFGVEDIIAAQLKRELAAAIKPSDEQLGLPPAAAPTVAPAGAPTDPFNPAVTPTGPVTQTDPTPTPGYEGSELQRSMRERSPLDDALQDSYDKYRYGDRTPSYYPDYGYRSPYGYDYNIYSPRQIVSVPTGTDGTGAGTPTVNGKPVELDEENNNYNTSPSGGGDNRPIGGNYNKSPYPNSNQGPRGGTANRAPSGGAGNRSMGGNTNTAPSGGAGNRASGGNTVKSSGGNSVSGSSGNSNTSGAGSNSR